MTKIPKQAKLVLEDGSEYSGWSFGKARSQAGEIVFSTGMTGLSLTVTDPASHGQIFVVTYPLAGNCGVALDKNGEPALDNYSLPIHFESKRIHVSGLVVSEVCDEPSHYTSTATLSSWLEKNNVPGIFGIDTRALTVRLREQGVMMGKILVEGTRDVTLDSGIVSGPAGSISPFPEDFASSTKKPAIVLVDCGAKASLIRFFLNREVSIIRVPWNYDLGNLPFDGMVLSGGPGDPKAYGKTIATVRHTFNLGKPVFGTGLGCQIMALAAGADSHKLPFGHRGLNHPCIEQQNSTQGRCFITSQNHGYTVRKDTLPSNWEPWFINNNDGTVEGIRSKNGPFSAVQFYPEGCPGPQDTEFLFDRFIDQVKEQKK